VALLLIIVGAGASYDSIPSRVSGSSRFEDFRLPLADALFEPREMFEEIQRAVPQVLQIASSLLERVTHEPVEDVLGRYADQVTVYPQRHKQLAAVRFYIQGVIDLCERGWYRDRPVATNLMALIDLAESFRRDGERPLFVTFNYDRLIENALENRGQSFASMTDYIRPEGFQLFKLHGSVDWARRIESMEIGRFHGGPWEIAKQICDEITTLPPAGNIEIWSGFPSSNLAGSPAVPAIAIPVKEKSTFECPNEHINALRSALPQVTTVLTIGWRGAERHFLQLLRQHITQPLEVICVTKGAAEETIQNMQSAGLSGHFSAYTHGFTNFVAERLAERLFRLTWDK
jgi:hypothetical protein